MSDLLSPQNSDPSVGSVPPPSAVAAASGGEGGVTGLARLTKIQIQNYLAYRGKFILDLPNGENLLVYGENGSGKSSLYHALRIFLEAPDHFRYDLPARRQRPLSVTDHRHRFTTEAPEVTLKFGPNEYQWSETKDDTREEPIRFANQGKGFLDYKALLHLHYVPMDQGGDIDVFPLIMYRLLPYYTYPNRGQNLSYQHGWKHLQSFVREYFFGSRGQHFNEDLSTFNDALRKEVRELGVRASEILAEFDDEFAVEFQFKDAVFLTKPRKHIVDPQILVRPAFRKQQIADYYSFFNEARLSSLAICLFFAALKNSPAKGLRVLALDDILIGLDMANRLKVLELIHKHFHDWQILIFTYSKAWFELLKERVKALDWSVRWESIVLREEWQGDESSPRVVAEGSGDLLEMADRHLLRKDYTAAAVYARSALEALCHRICAKAGLHVVHVEQQKDRKLEDYLDVLEHRLGELSNEIRRNEALHLIARLRQARAFVLNRKSHFDVEEEDTLSGEVGSSIQVVKDFVMFLAAQSWKHREFKHDKVLSAAERMGMLLAEARKLVGLHGQSEAVTKLVAAHNLAWEAFGLREKVRLPIGDSLSAKSIWDAALEQKKLEPGLDAQLKVARPYLFGNVEGKDFNAAKFDEAVKLLEVLAAPVVNSSQPGING